jgi:hypothetical protein
VLVVEIQNWMPIFTAGLGAIGGIVSGWTIAWTNMFLAHRSAEANIYATQRKSDAEMAQHLNERFTAVMQSYEFRIKDLTREADGLRHEVIELRREVLRLRIVLKTHINKVVEKYPDLAIELSATLDEAQQLELPLSEGGLKHAAAPA